MMHPAPKGIAVSHCPKCSRFAVAHWVNKLDAIPERYCRGGTFDPHERTRLEVHLYAHEKQVAP
jgi:hypothetical protein